MADDSLNNLTPGQLADLAHQLRDAATNFKSLNTILHGFAQQVQQATATVGQNAAAAAAAASAAKVGPTSRAGGSIPTPPVAPPASFLRGRTVQGPAPVPAPPTPVPSMPWNRKRKAGFRGRLTGMFGRRFGRGANRAAAYARGVGGRAAGAFAQGAIARGAQVFAQGAPLGYTLKAGLAGGMAAAGPAAIAMAGLAGAAVKAVKGLDDFARSASEANRSLSYASAEMAFVENRARFEQRLIDRENGNRLSRSAAALAESEKRFESQVMDWDILKRNVGNWLATAWNYLK